MATLTKVLALVIGDRGAFYRVAVTDLPVATPPPYDITKKIFRVRISDDWAQGAIQQLEWAEGELDSLVRVFGARGYVNANVVRITVRVEKQIVEMTPTAVR